MYMTHENIVIYSMPTYEKLEQMTEKNQEHRGVNIWKIPHEVELAH